MDAVKHNCGIFAVYNHTDALKLTHHGILQLQHRGQESAGIAWIEDGKIERFLGMGWIKDIFSTDDAKENFWNKKATMAIGHTRYSTSDGNKLKNAQPLLHFSTLFRNNTSIDVSRNRHANFRGGVFALSFISAGHRPCIVS